MRKTAQIIPYNQINEYIKNFQDKKTVLTGGCFDLIHYGHLQFLRKAKEEGDFLIIALESDEFIKKHKRKDPIHSQNERAEILSELNMVDLVINLPFFKSNEDYFDMVKIIRPNIIAVTNGDRQIENKRKQASEVNAKVVIVSPLLEKYSTRKIISDFS